MKTKSYDFNHAATKIQSWYRMVLIKNMLRLARSRYSSICTTIDAALAYPGYRFEDRIDCIIIGGGEGSLLHPPLFMPYSTQISRAPVSLRRSFNPVEESGGKKSDTDVPADKAVAGDNEGKTRVDHDVLHDNGATTGDDTVTDRSQLEASSSSYQLEKDANYLSSLLIEERWIESAIIERIKELRSVRK